MPVTFYIRTTGCYKYIYSLLCYCFSSTFALMMLYCKPSQDSVVLNNKHLFSAWVGGSVTGKVGWSSWSGLGSLTCLGWAGFGPRLTLKMGSQVLLLCSRLFSSRRPLQDPGTWQRRQTLGQTCNLQRPRPGMGTSPFCWVVSAKTSHLTGPNSRTRRRLWRFNLRDHKVTWPTT